MNMTGESTLALRDALAERDAARLELSRLRMHQEMLLAISGTMELDALLALLNQQLLAIHGVDGVIVTLLDDNGNNLVIKNLRYPDEYRSLESTFLNYKIPLSEPGNPHISALQDRKEFVSDALTGDDNAKLMLSRWKLRQSITWPIIAEGEGVGTVMILCQGKTLGEAARQRVRGLLDLFSQTLWHALRYDRLHQQKKAFEAAASEQERFLQFVTEVNNLTLPERIYEMIANELMRRMPFELAAVFMEKDGVLDCCKTVPKNDFFAPQAQAFLETCQRDPILVDFMEGGVAMAFIRGMPMVFADVKPMMGLPMSAKARAALESLGSARTLVNMPIRAKGKSIGVLLLISLVEPYGISGEELRLFELLSSFFGSAISNAKTYELAEGQRREIERLNLILQDKVDELADQVATDKLTGLFNFRSFEQELLRRVNEYERNAARQGLSIVMVDIDHFKRFNDEYGHAAGNVVLAGVAQEVAKLSRKMDMACRYGGEEFVVILPKCEADGALIFAERVRVAVEKARFKIESGEELGVTVSVGVSTFAEGDSQQSLFERADQALYRAKRGGRNQVSA